jgi:hypothetical protein
MLFVTLLWPTSLMGASLPLLRTGITDINTDVHPRDESDIPEIFDPSLLRPEGSR